MILVKYAVPHIKAGPKYAAFELYLKRSSSFLPGIAIEREAVIHIRDLYRIYHFNSHI